MNLLPKSGGNFRRPSPAITNSTCVEAFGQFRLPLVMADLDLDLGRNGLDLDLDLGRTGLDLGQTE